MAFVGMKLTPVVRLTLFFLLPLNEGQVHAIFSFPPPPVIAPKL